MSAITVKRWLTGFQQPGPRLRALVHVLLILLLCHGLAQLTWRLWPQPEALPPLVSAAAPVAMASGGGVGELARQIPAWHLFGEPPQEVAAPLPADLPETSLKLTLRGLIASTDPAEARAIVADPAGKENFYRVGDTLPGNAELTEIHADRIVIRRGARHETLKLPKQLLEVERTPTPRGNTTALAPRRSYSLREYRDTLLRDPQQVADLVRINPAYDKGRFVGYALQPGRDEAFLARYGLRPGDVVTSVNGVELDSPAKGLSLLKDLAGADTLNMVVERNGIRQRFTLPVN